MIHYRSFHNSDPPALVDIWRGHANLPGLSQPMSVPRLEQLVLAKPYFDRDGLIVALQDDQPIGFAHAGFGPNEDETGLCRDLGVTCVLLVHPCPEQDEIERELLARCESYLTALGANTLYAGAIQPLTPFYLGLYGGSEPPGVLQGDTRALALYRSRGYQEIDRTVTLHLELARAKPIVDRHQIQIRRRSEIQETIDPPPATWWQACTLGCYEQVRYVLRPRDGGAALATATFWNMEPSSTSLGVPTVGLIEVEVAPQSRREGFATYLLGEAFRKLRASGFGMVEAHTMRHNAAALALYQKLGFVEVAQGTVLRKGGPGGGDQGSGNDG